MNNDLPVNPPEFKEIEHKAVMENLAFFASNVSSADLVEALCFKDDNHFKFKEIREKLAAAIHVSNTNSSIYDKKADAELGRAIRQQFIQTYFNYSLTQLEEART